MPICSVVLIAVNRNGGSGDSAKVSVFAPGFGWAANGAEPDAARNMAAMIADSGAPIGPREAISVREAIHSYTVGGAFAMKHEAWRGTLLPGMAADLIAIDRDPFTASGSELRQTKVLLTMLRGEVVHDVRSQRADWQFTVPAA